MFDVCAIFGQLVWEGPGGEPARGTMKRVLRSWRDVRFCGDVAMGDVGESMMYEESTIDELRSKMEKS